MQPDHVEIVRRTYEGWAQGRMKAGTDLLHPDVGFETFMPDSDERFVTRGPEGIEAFLRAFLAHWRDYRILAEEFIEVPPDRVLVQGRQTAVGRGSGVLVEDTMHSIWTFRNGQVVKLHFERDRNRAREAAGLPPV